jgi:hypothetical protein
MQEIISCPSCKKKLQVPEGLLGQDVQCPTCGATFTARVNGQAPAPAPAPDRYSDRPRDRWADDDRDRDRDRDRDDDRDWDRDRRRGGYDRERRRDLMPHRGGAVLTLGIISIVATTTLSCMFGIGALVGLILGIVAWTMGNTDMTEIRAGRMDPDGESSTNAGRICGIIGTILSGLAVVGVCLYFGFIFVMMASGSMR